MARGAPRRALGRLSTLTAFLVLALITVLGGSIAVGRPPSAVAGPRPVRTLANAAGCAVPAPTTAAEYQRAIDALPQGGDATLSVRLASGRVAWIFADSFIPGAGLPHSTVVMQEDGCFRPTRTQLLPDDADGTFWWPMAAAALPDGTVLVTATNGYGTRVRAAICRETGGVLAFAHWLGHWPQPGGLSGVYYGAGLLVDGDRLLVYGTRSTGRRFVFGRELYVATVRLDGLVDQRAWRLDDAPVFGAAPHGSDQVVAPYRDATGYHLVTLLDGVYGHGPVVSLDSRNPAGPFTVHTLFRYSRTGQVHYDAAVHPEARVGAGRVLVTINNNWPVHDTGLHPLKTYQPSFFAPARIAPPASAS